MKKLVALWVQNYYGQDRQSYSEHHNEHRENIATHLLVVAIDSVNLLDELVHCRIFRVQAFL